MKIDNAFFLKDAFQAIAPEILQNLESYGYENRHWLACTLVSKGFNYAVKSERVWQPIANKLELEDWDGASSYEKVKRFVVEVKAFYKKNPKQMILCIEFILEAKRILSLKSLKELVLYLRARDILRIENTGWLPPKFAELKSVIETSKKIEYSHHLRNFYKEKDKIIFFPKEIFQTAKKMEFQGNLITKIPVEIGQGTNLENLNLSKNKIKRIPKEIELCTNLSYLNLSNNKIEEMPKEIEQCRKLYKLNLSKNEIKKIPKEIWVCTNLSYLNLSNNNIEEPQLALPNRSKEALHICNLSNNRLKTVPRCLFRIDWIPNLDLSFNSISHGLKGFWKKRYISTYLNLSHNRLSEKDFEFPSCSISSDWFWNLSNNLFSSIPDVVGAFWCLDFSFNQIKNVHFKSGDFYIKKLNLSNNKLTSFNFDVGGGLEELTDLDLSSNQLTKLPDAFSKLKKLITLSLANNLFFKIPFDVPKHPSLRILNLRKNKILCLKLNLSFYYNNNLLGCDEQYISLHEMDLSHNKLTKIHRDIKMLPFLKTLNLSFNEIKKVNDKISCLSNLERLNLSNNQLIKVSNKINQLIRLENLDLSNNQLQEVPLAVTKLTNLQNLNLSQNLIRNLPIEIKKSPVMKVINIDGNLINALAKEMDQVTHLKHIDLKVSQIVRDFVCKKQKYIASLIGILFIYTFTLKLS